MPCVDLIRNRVKADHEKFEDKLDKYLKALSGFRDDVRKLAIGGGSSQDILKLCDRFRDQELVNLGVQLDDGQGAGECPEMLVQDVAQRIRWSCSV